MKNLNYVTLAPKARPVSDSDSFKMFNYQVIKVAENVDTEKCGADSEDVEIELMIRQNTHVPGQLVD